MNYRHSTAPTNQKTFPLEIKMRDNHPAKVNNIRFLSETELSIQIGKWYAKILSVEEECRQIDEYDTTRPYIPKGLILASDLKTIGQRGFIIIPLWLARHNNLETIEFPKCSSDNLILTSHRRPTEGLWVCQNEPSVK
jgi:hypothetical protein